MIEPDGTTILRNKMNKPWQDFLQAAGLAYGANRAAAVDIARSANNTAESLGAQKAATANNAINAEVEKLGISTAAEVEKLRIVTPVNP
jgi:Zn-dependent alcohol dehydrogenase